MIDPNKRFNPDLEDEELEIEIEDSPDPDEGADHQDDEDEGEPAANTKNSEDDDDLSDDDDDLGEDGDQPRMGKRAEKRIKQLVRRAKEAEERAKQYEAQIQELSTKSTETTERLRKTEEIAFREYGERLEAQEVAVKDIMRQSTEAGDVDKQLEAQQKLAELYSEKSVFNQYKRRHDANAGKSKGKGADEEQKPVRKQEDAPAPDRNAVKWHNRNPWFGDTTRAGRIMTNAAVSIHQELVEEGIDPRHDVEEYYNELDARLQEVNPDFFKNRTQRKNKDQVVSSVNKGGPRGNPQKKSRKVKLTREQVEMANRLGIKLEDYAREVAKREGAND